MLEQKDLKAIEMLLKSNNEQMKTFIEEKIGQSEERMKAHVEEKIGQSEERMKVHIGEKVVLSERFLLEEMERMHSSVDAKIDFLQRNISELTQYYKITKLESDNL